MRFDHTHTILYVYIHRTMHVFTMAILRYIRIFTYNVNDIISARCVSYPNMVFVLLMLTRKDV